MHMHNPTDRTKCYWPFVCYQPSFCHSCH